MSLRSSSPAPWTRRFLLAAVVALLPLFVFGGSVTTLGAGMAVQGWWNAEGHFMPLFPLEKWFRNLPTFVEHSHRQLGLVVGLAMICACASAWLSDRRLRARMLVLGATLAVALQGWLGGSRVLEASPELAFLHGACAQLVFALMLAAHLYFSPRWSSFGVRTYARARSLRCAAVLAFVATYAQIAVGAAYRHSLRTGLGGNAAERFNLHLVGGCVAAILIALLGSKLGEAADGDLDSPLHGDRRRMQGLLAAQIGLGLLAHLFHRSGSVGFAEWLFATLHVLVGALLLAHCAFAIMWAFALVAPPGVVFALPARAGMGADHGGEPMGDSR
jgi:heme A synthase